MIDSHQFKVGQSTAELREIIKEDRSQQAGGTSHYVGWAVGDFIHSAGLDFFEGNIVKYVCRHKKKNGRSDLVKARTYIDKLLELHYPKV